jgi:hypothetical protein
MPALMSLSKHELRQELQKKVREGMWGDGLEAITAHCGSFNELQYVVSLVERSRAGAH